MHLTLAWTKCRRSDVEDFVTFEHNNSPPFLRGRAGTILSHYKVTSFMDGHIL